MKLAAKSTLYFSAYPLKAVKETSSPAPTSTGSPYLRAVLAGTGSVKATSRVRVFPMTNPYKKSDPVNNQRKHAKDVQSGRQEWFNHYE